jgi:hypothetical protein
MTEYPRRRTKQYFSGKKEKKKNLVMDLKGVADTKAY